MNFPNLVTEQKPVQFSKSNEEIRKIGGFRLATIYKGIRIKLEKVTQAGEKY